MRLRVCFFALVIFVVPLPVLAGQKPCTEDETPAICLERMRTEVKAKAAGNKNKKEAVDQQADTAKKTEAGIDSLGNVLSSTMKDFLPLVQLSSLLGPFEQDATTGVVTVAMNHPWKGDHVQVRAIIDPKPKLFAPLRDAVTKEVAESLDKSIAAGKSVVNATAEFSYSFEGGSLGRDFTTYRAIVDRLFLAGTGKSADQIVADEIPFSERVRAAESAVDGVGKIQHEQTTFKEITAAGGLTAAARATQLSDALAAQARQFELSDEAFRKTVTDTGLDLLGQLVNNQPQFFITVAYQHRDELLGPDDVWTFRGTYEFAPGANLNAFKRYARQDFCNPDGKSCLEQYSAFAKLARARIKAGQRFAVSAEAVVRKADYEPRFDGDTLGYGLPKGTSVAATIDWGTLFGVSDDGHAAGRFDLALKAERLAPTKWPTDSSEKAVGRVVVSLTITKKLGDASIPFCIVYANRSAYLPTDIDHQLSAHVGIKFNAFSAKK